MNVIDILILAALAVSVIFGMYRGFISGVLSVAALIGAAAAAFAISPSLATWLQGNETLVNTLMYYTDAGSRIKDLDLSLLTVAQASQSAVAQIISGAQLPQQFQAAFINAVNTAPGATTMSTLLSQTIVNVSLSILSFLICFLGCYIVASFLIHLICYVFELPVLRHLDALMGGVFGLARGVLLLFIFFALVPIIQAVVPVQQLTDVFTASRLALRILLHRYQIADGLTAALLLALLLANLSGGGFRADGLPDQLQIRAPRPQRQQRVHRHRRRQQQRHGGQPLHAKVNRRAEQRQRAGCADDEIRVSRLFRVFPERDSRLVG